MCFQFLLLGHLLGDFTFQTNKIAENKTRYWRWNLLHAAIVTACMLLFAAPFGPLIMGLVILCGAIHLFIDTYKSKLAIGNPLKALFYFLIDQGLHISAIYIISTFAKQDSLNYTIFKEEVIKLLLVVLFIYSFSCILIQQVLRLFFPTNNKQFFVGNEKVIGNLTRIITFFSLYFSFYLSAAFLLMIPIVIIVILYYYIKIWDKWMNAKYYKVKLFMDLTAAAGGFYILLSITH